MQYLAADALALLKGCASILLWGPPITGKTRSLATLIGNIHIFDIDNKCQSLLLALQKSNRINDVRVYRYSGKANQLGATVAPKRSDNLYLKIMEDVNKYYDQVNWGNMTWKDPKTAPSVLVLDSLTTYQDIVMDFVLATLGHELGDPKTDARNDYGLQMKKITETINTFKGLPCHFVCIAHEQFVEDKNTGGTYTFPLVTGKGTLAPSLAHMFNIVLYTQQDYKWLTKGGGLVKSAGSTLKDDIPKLVAQDFALVMDVQ